MLVYFVHNKSLSASNHTFVLIRQKCVCSQHVSNLFSFSGINFIFFYVEKSQTAYEGCSVHISAYRNRPRFFTLYSKCKINQILMYSCVIVAFLSKVHAFLKRKSLRTVEASAFSRYGVIIKRDILFCNSYSFLLLTKKKKSYFIVYSCTVRQHIKKSHVYYCIF